MESELATTVSSIVQTSYSALQQPLRSFITVPTATDRGVISITVSNNTSTSFYDFGPSGATSGSQEVSSTSSDNDESRSEPPPSGQTPSKVTPPEQTPPGQTPPKQTPTNVSSSANRFAADFPPGAEIGISVGMTAVLALVLWWLWPKRWRFTRKAKGVSRTKRENPSSESGDSRSLPIPTQEESSIREKTKSQ